MIRPDPRRKYFLDRGGGGGGEGVSEKIPVNCQKVEFGGYNCVTLGFKNAYL